MLDGRGIPLGGRLGLLLVAAVLPLATLSAVYAWMAGDTVRQIEMRARFETARLAAEAVEGGLDVAGRSVEIALSAAGALTDPQVCGDRLARLLTRVDTLSDAMLYAGDRPICGRIRTADGLRPITDRHYRTATLSDGAVTEDGTGGPAFRIVRRPQDRPDLVAVVHVDLDAIWRRITESVGDLGAGQVFLLTEVGGIIVDSGSTLPPATIAAVVAALNEPDVIAGLSVHPVHALGIGFVAIAGVGGTGLKVAVGSDGDRVTRSLPMRIAMVILLPVLFLIAAVAIAWFGVDRLVNRWVRRLGRTTRIYGEGDLSARVGPMPDAAEEFRALGRSFDAMASRIEHRSFELEHALNEKAHFVKELHHRVKNNFQMIASLLTLQRRDCDGPTEAAIREAHDRVQAMAAAYRASYADGEAGSVPVGALLIDLMGRLRESAGLSSRVIGLTIAPEPLALPLDRAIPFALLMTELLVPILDQAIDEEETIKIEAHWADASHATIAARIVTPLDTAETGRPLPERLVRAYAAQLGASVSREPGAIDVRLPHSG